MDEDQLRRENILNIILIGSIGLLALLDGIVLVYSIREGAHYQGVPFLTFSLLPAFFIFLYLIARKGFSTIAAYLLIATYTISNSYAAYRWGVTLQVVILTYALIIVVATILRGTKFGFITTIAISAFIIPLWYLQFNRIIPMDPVHLRVADGFIFALIYFLIMVVAWLYNREIARSLKRARASEQALTEERDLLEINIKKRTDELAAVQLEKVEQLKRFAELGQLSSGLFHDTFNFLNAISLREEGERDPSLENALNTTKQIKSFMEAVRKQIGLRNDTKELFSLDESIHQVIQLLTYKANKNHVQIVFDAHQENIASLNSPFKFHQIMLNLILNAIESYDHLDQNDQRNRIITITLESRNKTITIEVQDNGAGMPEAVRAHIFEPFFTTKHGESGIGIGLAMVKEAVEKEFHGTIAVQSEINKGSRFTIQFPLSNERIPENDLPGG